MLKEYKSMTQEEMYTLVHEIYRRLYGKRQRKISGCN